MGSQRFLAALVLSRHATWFTTSFAQRDQRYKAVEDFLLVFDEIDDLYSTVGLIWRQIVSFLVAVALFIATGFVFITFPTAAEMLVVGLVGLGLLEMVRQRRLSLSNENAVVDRANEAR